MNPITSCDEMPGLVDEEPAVDIVCLVFKKAFNTVSCKLMGRQRGGGLKTGLMV